MSRILQDKFIELLALNVFYSSKQGKNDLKGNSELIRAASLVSERKATDSLSAGRITFANVTAFY